MDKRKEANLKVKKLITDALLALMEKKDINEISVTELITTAGVARVSFYRNYSSKENVLIVLINFILNDFRGGKEYDEIDYRTIEHIEQCFNYIYKYRNYILGLYRCNYATVLLEELNRFHEAVAGEMSVNSVEKYAMYMFMGAMFNSGVAWLKDGAKQSAREVAEVFCRFVGIEF